MGRRMRGAAAAAGGCAGGRAATPRVLHADETPVAMLKPGKSKTHRAYIWSYCTTSYNPTKAVVFDFAETRSGENVREFLRPGRRHAWKGTLVTDGYSG